MSQSSDYFIEYQENMFFEEQYEKTYEQLEAERRGWRMLEDMLDSEEENFNQILKEEEQLA